MPPPTRSVSHPSALDLSSTAPRIQATPALRAFRHEAQMSWSSFNRLWMDISQILNSPSFDILLDCRSALTHNYVVRLADLTRHVLASGAFGPTTVGRWHQGRHEEEADRDQIIDFVERLTAHAVAGIMAVLLEYGDPCEIKADKVGAWLKNEEATMWDEYEFTDREPPVSNEVYVYDDDCTAVAPLRGVAPSATRVPETVCTESRVEETVDGGEFVAGLFD